MRVRFLLGPAGSGKTTRCLEGIRTELGRAPEGPPLLLIAPKQATFQLERMLLEGGGVPGWTRLQILSFDRLASQVLEQSRPTPLLNEEGRIMVLRALLRRHRAGLRVFHSTARLTGFARELSTMLREFQQHRAQPARLEELAGRFGGDTPIALKLHDLALLMRAYHDWLRDRGLHDPDTLVELAAQALQEPGTPFNPAGLWIDGFAEMTPQEIDLFAAAAVRADQVTAAFCVDAFRDQDLPWSSPWSVVHQTFRKVHQRLAALNGSEVEVETLRRSHGPSRFDASPVLAHLERAWTQPVAVLAPDLPEAADTLRCVACADVEREAEVAAREICRTARQGVRYREMAVLLRSLDHHHAALERVFLRYGIPYFLDRRSSLAHHPLAELVRCAVRLAALGWQHEDWFGALKTGLHRLPDALVDQLENKALARGWDASFWQSVPSDNPPPELEPHTGDIAEVVTAFERFADGIGQEPDATILAKGLRRLWLDLGVQDALDAWIENEGDLTAGGAFLHRTAREQILQWLENVERGFANDPVSLVEWLPILDAGLASLTAGAIPPAQDQVLIGAIDRSRQPDLKLAILMGWNEGRFPAPPVSGGLLTDAERERLTSVASPIVGERLRLIGHERYFGYIAVTRARARILVTWSTRDASGRPLAPSPFVRQIQVLFPSLPVESDASEAVEPSTEPGLLAARLTHRSELLPWLLSRTDPTALDGLAGDALRRSWLRRYRDTPSTDRLSPAVAETFLGHDPVVSVSGLESFAACPFQFFIRHSLRATEREEYAADPRHIGSLAHEILAQFHDGIIADELEWRDHSEAAARDRLKTLAEVILARPDHAVFRATPAARWRTDTLIRQLADLVAVLTAWSRHTDFTPRHAELAFATVENPAWHVPTPGGRTLRVRGKVDRIDTWTDDSGETWFLILDYKLSPPRLADDLIAAGIDLQLAAYALALPSFHPWKRHVLLADPEESDALPTDTTEAAPEEAPARRPRPAGMFYIPLRARPKRSGSREAPADDGLKPLLPMFVHRGRFDASLVDHLDTEGAEASSGQYAFHRNQNGSLKKGGDGRPAGEFQDLLGHARAAIERAGDRIGEGDASVSPYRKGAVSACDRCDLRPVCRFDPWTQPFRRVPPLAKATADEATA